MKRRGWIYLGLTFGFTWFLWGSQILNARIIAVPLFLIQLGMIANWGPLLARLALERRSIGGTGLRGLWIDLWKEPKKMQWLGIVAFLGMGPAMLSQMITSLFFEQPFQWSYPPTAWGLVWFTILFFGGGLEEFGWRGWLYPHLRKQWNPFVVGIVVGSIHALWHLPLHFIPGTVQQAMPFWEFFLLTATSGWIYAWIMMRAKGVFAALMYHTFANFGAAICTYWMIPEGRWISFGVQSLLILGLFIHSRHRWMET